MYLDVDLVNQLENSSIGSLDGDALAIFIGIVTLHEFVHYGDFNYNGNKWKSPYEEGYYFEKEVYGKIIDGSEDVKVILKKR
ncbi:hypothetical protein GBO34_15235 [Roseivirga pacifica]|nr:hypothetical protein [Roseivirga pacifica]MCO6367151.1 hypothetical protein [Roseivirga pacifica]MCO6370317.1 hypothetical protein [Roseivirga pacifica]MCO6374808.1 hypothetical protein [Roseivirga pacifica]MCO6380066.1 hypothetical protein [Roseivirga pacifica]